MTLKHTEIALKVVERPQNNPYECFVGTCSVMKASVKLGSD